VFVVFACDLWCMMYGVWCMEYDVWCMVYDVWCMMYHHVTISGSDTFSEIGFVATKYSYFCRSVVYGVWCVVHGVWCMVYGVLGMVCEWSVACWSAS